MSLGIHRLWKDQFVKGLVPRLPASKHQSASWSRSDSADSSETSWNPALKCLDVAGGTGDIALRILDHARERYGSRDVEVEVVDLNEQMLDEGRKRVAKTIYYNSQLAWFAVRNFMLTSRVQPLRFPSPTVMRSLCRLASPPIRLISTPSRLVSGIALRCRPF